MMNRSEELQSLSKNEVEDEKLALQKALLYFENIHGRPVTKDEKGLSVYCLLYILLYILILHFFLRYIVG